MQLPTAQQDLDAGEFALTWVPDWLKIALKAVLRPAQVCARSSKFSLFDPAKEMAYIQMSRKEKSKGKAAVDLIGSQVQNSLTAESSLREEPVPMQ